MRIPSWLLGTTGRILALILLGALIASLRPAFLQPINLINVLRQASLLILLASGLTFTILLGGIDLSVGAVLAAAATTGGYLLVNGYPISTAMIVPLLMGAAFGLANGLLVTKVGLAPFVATYGMLWVAQGVANLVMQGEIFFGFPPSFLFLGAGWLWGVPVPVLIMFAVVAIFAFVQNRTVLGREIYMIGANTVAARFAGVNVTKVSLLAYTLSGFMAAATGLVMIARMDAAEASVGEPMLLPALASVVLGGTSLSGGSGGIGGTIIGALIMTVIINGMNLLGIPSFWQPLVVGTIIVISVGLDKLSRLRSTQEAALMDAAASGPVGKEAGAR